MAVENEKVKAFEEEYRGMVFEKIDKLCSIQYGGLPNIGVTVNNKLVQLAQEFQRAGISIYSQTYEDYGLMRLNFVGTSPIGEAIIFDLLEQANEGITKLAGNNEELTGKRSDEPTQEKSLDIANPCKRLLAYIRNFLAPSPVRSLWEMARKFFIPIKQNDLLYANQETEDHRISGYVECDEQLYQYNLRDNVISSIVKLIREKKYSAWNIPGLVEECITPDLQKLGLGDLVPQLQEALIEAYKGDLTDIKTDIIPDDKMYLYVPDFNGETEKGEEFDFQEFHRMVAQTTEQVTALCDGIAIDDMCLVDETVSAETRGRAVEVLKGELDRADEVELDVSPNQQPIIKGGEELDGRI